EVQSERRASIRSSAQLSQLPSSKVEAFTHSVSLPIERFTSRSTTTVGGTSSMIRMYLYHSLWFQQWSAASYRTSVSPPSQPLNGIRIGWVKWEYVYTRQVSPPAMIRYSTSVCTRSTARSPTMAFTEWMPLQLSMTCTSGT